MAVIEDFKQLLLNIRSVIDSLLAKDAVLEASIDGLEAVPDIIGIKCNPALEVDKIYVTLNKPKPSDYNLVVRSIRDDTVQGANMSWSSGDTECTVTTTNPVITPFLVVLEKSSVARRVVPPKIVKKGKIKKVYV
jgi:hypothetical protein